MNPSLFTNKLLTLILITIAVMIVVISVLIGALLLSSSNSVGISSKNASQTANVDSTVAALVSTMLVSDPTQMSTSGSTDGEVTGSGVEESQGLQESPTPESFLDKLQSPTPLPSMTPTANPQITRTNNPWVESALEKMSLSQKVGQMILSGVQGSILTPEICQFVQRISPGGIIYLSTNISGKNLDQLTSLSLGLQNCMVDIDGVPLLISVDHEGYYVNRFPNQSQITVFPPAMAFGATGNPEYAYQAASAAGLELRSGGINMVLGPVADVLINLDNTVISQRSYGGDPIAVGELVGRVVEGYLSSGILPVLKHYPGHGDVSGDSHSSLPVDQADLTRLFDTHLVPFQAGIESRAPMVMVSHVAFPTVDSSNLPASLSTPLYQLLWDEMDFQGFTLSDSMGMGAIGETGLSIEAASVKAINAGLDMLMLISPELAESVHSNIIWAVQNGEIPLFRIDQAVRRILDVKFEHGLITESINDFPAPNWSQNADLSYQIGYKSVSLYIDQANLVPLPSAVESVLVVGPADGWGLYPLLRSALDQRGILYNIMTYSGYWFGPIPETSYIQTVPVRASAYDLVIVFTWDSHPNRYRFGDDFQGNLVNSLLDGGQKLIVIALKSPTDILDFPGATTYLASMGTTPGQLDGIIDALTGETQPSGQIPFPGLP